MKAFGPGTDGFRTAVRNCAHDVVGPDRVRVGERLSRQGRRLCVTLQIQAETVDEVIDVYARLHGIRELMLIL